MPPPRRVPGPLADGPFAYATGLTHETRRRLSGPAYRGLTRGVRQAAALEATYASTVSAVRLALPAEAVLVGRTAAWALGVSAARSGDPVEVLLPASGRVRRRSGLVVRSGHLADDEVCLTRFGPTTTPVRTAYDLARSAELPRRAARYLHRFLTHEPELAPAPLVGPAAFGFREPGVLGGQSPVMVARRLVVAVAEVDQVLRRCRIGVEEVADMADRHRGARGIEGLRVVLALADPRAESPPESMLRCRFTLAGLPRPEPQFEIHDRGVFVARPDMSWVEWKLAAEYDGAYHDEVEGMPTKDRTRDAEAHGAGWELLHYDRFNTRDIPSMIARTHRVLTRRTGPRHGR